MRDRILEAAEQIVQDRGFSAVSFQQLADAVGLSKPSVFHHFRNRDALAEGLLHRCQTHYRDQYGAIVDSDAGAPDKLRAIAGIFESGLASNRLCLLGAIGNSVNNLPEPVGEDLRLTITQTIEQYARVFEQGQREGSLRFQGTSRDAAAAFLAMLQGLQGLARAQRRHETFREAAASYIDVLVV